MPIKNRTILKSKFQTRDKPTQGDFEDMIDSFMHKSESVIAIDSADPATDPGAPQGSRMFLASTDGTYTNFPDENDDPIIVDPDEAAFLVDNGSWFVKVIIPLNLTNYYTKAEVDTEVNAGDAAALSDANDYTDTKFLGVGSVGFQGVATIGTVPGAHVAGRSWLAVTTGTIQTFVNFGSVSIAASGLVFIYDNGVTYTSSVVSAVGDIQGVLSAGNSSALGWKQHGDDLVTWIGEPNDYNTAYGGAEGTVGRFIQGWYGFAQGGGREDLVATFWGYNQSVGTGNQTIAAEASFGFRSEVHYGMLTSKYFEFHLPEVTTRSGSVFRPWSIYADKERGMDNSFIQSNIGSIEVSNSGGSYFSITNTDLNLNDTLGAGYIRFNMYQGALAATMRLATTTWDFYGAPIRFLMPLVTVYNDIVAETVRLTLIGNAGREVGIQRYNSSYATVSLRDAAQFYNTEGGGSLCLLADGNLSYNNVLEYADNAAAVTGGLIAGSFYRTGDDLKIVH